MPKEDYKFTTAFAKYAVEGLELRAKFTRGGTKLVSHRRVTTRVTRPLAISLRFSREVTLVGVGT